MLAGAGGNHTAKAVFWARDARKAGADGILSVTPDSRPSTEGLVRHFSAIADATDLPILVSNVPSRTGTDLSVEAVLRLAEIPNVVGIKESSVDFAKIACIAASMPDGFLLFAGNDTTALAMIALGAPGADLRRVERDPGGDGGRRARRRSTASGPRRGGCGRSISR